jgi:membrane protease subunit HflC
MNRKIIIKVAIIIAVILVATIIGDSMYTVETNEYALVKQLGRVIDQKSEPGLYFKIPFVQGVTIVDTSEQMYDLASSDVITSDKKTMIADCYATWRVKDPLKYYQTLKAAQSTAESRLDVVVYNAMKNVISATKQEDIITGKDGSLDQAIMAQINDLEEYGLEVTDVEMKLLDLPEANKISVYGRMISERNVISAQYTAEGKQQATEIENRVDSTVRVMLSDAQTKAASLEAEGNAEYYRILAEAYNGSAEAREFYQYVLGLNSLKEALSNGGTIVIDENSPMYDILMDVNG